MPVSLVIGAEGSAPAAILISRINQQAIMSVSLVIGGVESSVLAAILIYRTNQQAMMSVSAVTGEEGNGNDRMDVHVNNTKQSKMYNL
jgi:hypothetical protein